MTVGELVFEVSDRASVLVREEIELAKTEVTEKVNRLLRGSVVGLVAGVFVLLALALGMHGIAWLLNDEVFNNDWAGFFVEAGRLPADRGGRRLLRLPLVQARRAPRPGDGDRGGEGDQGGLRRRGR